MSIASSAEEEDDRFTQSYQDFRSYPSNLIDSLTHPAALLDFENRLGEAEPTLFKGGQDGVVFFREFDALGRVESAKIIGDEKLQHWLSDRDKIIVDPADLLAIGGNSSSKHRQPKCRFVFFLADHSWNPLNVDSTMFRRILGYYQVNPAYLNFCFCFGLKKSRPTDFRFSGFRSQSSFTNASPLKNYARGLSGLHFQLSYNLRVIELSKDPGTHFKDKNWVRRQAAFHHQFDIVQGTSLWVITSGRDTLKKRIKLLLPGNIREQASGFATTDECLESALKVHMEFFQWCTAECRWYLQWLEEKIEDLSEAAIDADIISFSDVELRILQSYEDRVNEAIMVFQTNSTVMESIKSFYDNLPGQISLPWKTHSLGTIKEFSAQVSEMTYDLRMHISRAQVLVKISEDRKLLLQQRIQAHAAREMAELTVKMQKVTEDGQKEAVAVRIITIITLIYLPATFVSTFFSTDIVRYDGNETSFSGIALRRWLQVTLPLTFLTLGSAAWWFWLRSKTKHTVKHLLSKLGPDQEEPTLIEQKKGTFYSAVTV